MYLTGFGSKPLYSTPLHHRNHAAAARPRGGGGAAALGSRSAGDVFGRGAGGRGDAQHRGVRARRGGTLLYVPPGVWLTGPFNLTSRPT
jgi:hypothetical protein